MARRYSVWTARYAEGELKGIVSAFKVADWNDAPGFEYERDERHSHFRNPVAIFPAGKNRDAQEQGVLAERLKNHLNEILDTQEKAVKDEVLLQRISMPYNTNNTP